MSQRTSNPSRTPHQPVLLTVPQAAAALAISRAACYRLLASGRLPSVSIGRARRVPVRAVEEFVVSLLDAGLSVAQESLAAGRSADGDAHGGGLK